MNHKNKSSGSLLLLVAIADRLACFVTKFKFDPERVTLGNCEIASRHMVGSLPRRFHGFIPICTQFDGVLT